jgi:hypothetical protein
MPDFDRPPRPYEDRPWERPGGVRSDAVPPRSRLLLWLGGTGLVLGMLALPLGITALPGLPLSVAAWVLSQRDMAAMRADQMDLAGWHDARIVPRRGVGGALLSVAGLLLCGLVCSCIAFYPDRTLFDALWYGHE